MRQRNKIHRKPFCCKCKSPIEESRRNQGYCKKCHAENMRLKRPKHSELSEESRKKANCRAHTNVYIKRGKILIMPCWICGDKAEAHHEDYSKPKDVVWLCRKHHLEYHADKKINFGN